MKDVLRAAATAAFVVGLLLLMINPPSLSGAEELVSLIAGALGFSGVARGAATIAKVLFAIFLILFIIFLVLAFTAVGVAT